MDSLKLGLWKVGTLIGLIFLLGCGYGEDAVEDPTARFTLSASEVQAGGSLIADASGSEFGNLEWSRNAEPLACNNQTTCKIDFPTPGQYEVLLTASSKGAKDQHARAFVTVTQAQSASTDSSDSSSSDSSNSSSSSYTCQNPATSCIWREVTTNVAAENVVERDAGGFVVFNNKMWIMGGYRFNGSSNLNDVHSTTDGETWTQEDAGAGWSGRYSFANLVYNDGSGEKIWVIGGRSGSYHNDVWSSPDGDTWTELNGVANGWAGREAPGHVVYDNKMWIMGGKTGGSTWVNDVWSSTDGDTWTEVATNGSVSWNARKAAKVIVFDNKMWLFGGSSAEGGTITVHNDIYSSSDGATWVQEVADGSASWSKRDTHIILSYDSRLWLFSGRLTDYEELNDVWYSTDAKNWTQATSSANWAVRKYAHGAVYNNKMWIVSGYEGATDYKDVWNYGP